MLTPVLVYSFVNAAMVSDPHRILIPTQSEPHVDQVGTPSESIRNLMTWGPTLHVTILAYCLMPNHYHFMLRQDGEVTPSTFIQRLFLTYTQAFNKQQKRSGPLFQGRFSHVLVDRDEYAIHLCRYIHLNPVAADLVSQPQDWPYSNYLEWIGLREGTLVDHAFIQQFFPTPADYVAFVQTHLTHGKMQELRPYLLDDE
jgi:REP element-mobilizing transposase RayT